MRPTDPRFDDSDDPSLVTDMMAGNREAFAELFRRHRDHVFRFARQMGGSPEMADDVTQDVFIAFIETGKRFDPARGSLRAYLYGIARNLILRRLRRESLYADIIDEVAERSAETMTPPDPLAQIERTRALTRLRRAILALPPAYREVIVLCELHELSYVEAAQIADCPVGTIRSRLSRARRVLAQKCGDLSQSGDDRQYVPRRCLA
jgi:RNA polymerase sigma-70 factor (ECF subfamily)